MYVCMYIVHVFVFYVAMEVVPVQVLMKSIQQKGKKLLYMCEREGGRVVKAAEGHGECTSGRKGRHYKPSLLSRSPGHLAAGSQQTEEHI